ncbi:heme ABC exporter ATP-binding protein CcmA [Falsirhodobacter algicola]|uniref:Heme ABC exporter ATP-binding protein CcmA n=1 Tax=Falsirhodobacter algicola TaxID=2692330 RepID=A0A8J8SLX3_9RHOB|nr:heme ABC exporter ATP-binding protein CcmA [Falsirhodobacter algicola]QUS36869.1 heme ABC exporter ATP-binding protein CcmA [Falsirhodobacter algicola]
MELRVSGLGCMRGGTMVLRHLSLHLRAGEALILRGPNGAGKTTLLRTLAGLQPAAEGRIEAPEDAIAHSGHLDGVKAALTVRENLRFWASVHGRNIGTALEDMNLSDLAGRAAGTLSAGQKRRLGLARLLVTGRPIWLLDEPTVALDTASTALFVRMIQRHLAGGGIAIIATHVDLGLGALPVLDLGPLRAISPPSGSFDEAFL